MIIFDFNLWTDGLTKRVSNQRTSERTYENRFGSLSPTRVRCTRERNCNGTVYTSIQVDNGVVAGLLGVEFLFYLKRKERGRHNRNSARIILYEFLRII